MRGSIPRPDRPTHGHSNPNADFTDGDRTRECNAVPHRLSNRNPGSSTHGDRASESTALPYPDAYANTKAHPNRNATEPRHHRG